MDRGPGTDQERGPKDQGRLELRDPFSARSANSAIGLVLRRTLDVVDDEDRHASLLRLQLESELLMQRGEEIRQVLVERRVRRCAWPSRLGPPQRACVETLETRAIEHLS